MMMLILKTMLMIVYRNSKNYNYHYDCDDDKNGVVKTLMISDDNVDHDDDELKKFLGVRIAQAGGCHFPSFANQRPQASNNMMMMVTMMVMVTMMIMISSLSNNDFR